MIRRVMLGFLVVTAFALSASRGGEARGAMAAEDLWAAVHIDGLPPDIRRNLSKHVRRCGGPKALHYFSRYLSPRGSRHQFVSLHFEEFSCRDRAAICTSEDCLHQVYVSTGAGYRLVFEARVKELELKIIDGTPAIEISCAWPAGMECARVLRWNGSAFVRR